MDSSEIQKKLSVLGKKTSSLLEESFKNTKIETLLQGTKNAMENGRIVASSTKKGKDGYSPDFDKIAFDVLSSSPYTTKIHLCTTFRVSEHKIDEWVQSHDSFGSAIEQGLYEGELLARELLVQAAFEPSQKINTGLMKILSTNVYNIKDSHDVTVKAPEQIKFQIEVVGAGKS
jgi:hypothetical protein